MPRKKPTPKRPATPIVRDATLTFQIAGGAEDGRQVTIDLLILKILCEEIERRHNLTEAHEGRPTVGFLRDLAAGMGEQLDFACTPSLAYQIWHAATLAMLDLKKNTSD